MNLNVFNMTICDHIEMTINYFGSFISCFDRSKCVIGIAIMRFQYEKWDRSHDCRTGVHW